MGEKKGVKAFLKKTFELKKKPEDEVKAESAAKKPAATKPTATKPAATKQAAAKPAAQTSKPTQKAPPKTAPKTTAARQAATKTTATKPAATKTTATKPAATKTTATKPAATKTTATKPAATKTTATKPAATKPAAARPAAPKTTVSKTAATSKETGSAASKKQVEFSNKMTKADSVRFFIYRNYLKPAKLRGQNKMTLVAGDVHKDMGLKAEMPTVASAMKVRIDKLYDVEILDVKPPGGANSKLTVRYDLRNLYMEAEEKNEKPAAGKTDMPKSERSGKGKAAADAPVDAGSNYMVLKELEEKLRQFVSDRNTSKFGKEWWKGTDMSFLADRWKERRIMNERTSAGKKDGQSEVLINYASFSDYRRIINNPFAWDAFKEYFPNRGWIIQRLEELDPIRNAIMHHTPLDDDDTIRLGLYARDILKIIDKATGKAENKEKQNKEKQNNEKAKTANKK